MSEPTMVDDGCGDKMDALLLAAKNVIARSDPPRACWGDYAVQPVDWLALQAEVMERLREHAREACMPMDMPQEEFSLRLMLCMAYAGSGAYTDDGEMQDNSSLPFIDFRRDSAAEIQRKIIQRNLETVSAKTGL
jgi:hypothetical protein